MRNKKLRFKRIIKMNFLFIGDTNVGKTSIINYLLDCEDNLNNPITIGTNIRKGSVSRTTWKKCTPERVKPKVPPPRRGGVRRPYGAVYCLIDTGDYFTNEINILSHLYRVAGIFIVYDIRNFNSFANAKKIYRRLSHRFGGSHRGSKRPIMLLANKAENVINGTAQWGYARIQLNQQEGEEEEVELIKVSAKTGLNINKAFHKCVDNFKKMKNTVQIIDTIDVCELENNGYYITPLQGSGGHEEIFVKSYWNQFKYFISNSWNKVLSCCGVSRRKKQF